MKKESNCTHVQKREPGEALKWCYPVSQSSLASLLKGSRGFERCPLSLPSAGPMLLDSVLVGQCWAEWGQCLSVLYLCNQVSVTGRGAGFILENGKSVPHTFNQENHIYHLYPQFKLVPPTFEDQPRPLVRGPVSLVRWVLSSQSCISVRWVLTSQSCISVRWCLTSLSCVSVRWVLTSQSCVSVRWVLTSQSCIYVRWVLTSPGAGPEGLGAALFTSFHFKIFSSFIIRLTSTFSQ